MTAPAAPQAATNTRVENLAEAMENLCLALNAKRSPATHQFLQDARGQMRSALREFLQPLVRLVEDGPRQSYPADVPETDRVICGFCKKDHMCSQPNCEQWHNSVRAKVAMTASGEDTEPDSAA